MFDMRRREFITLLGGAAAAWPLAAHAQPGERVRLVGVLTYLPPGDAQGQARLSALTQGLAQSGWTEGRNLRIESRWANADDVRQHAAELVAMGPDVLVAATGTATVAPLLQATGTVPIVFVTVIDPVGAGFVASLAQPGGNATGFTIYEYSMSGKWLELLKEIAPRVTRAAVLRDPAIASGIGQFGAVQIVAPSLGVQVSPVDVRDAGVNRARRHGIRARVEWRPDRNGERIGDESWPNDHRACGPASATRGLLRPLPRHGRWPHLLRA
jgi:putative tryptophan/tyrosine transport system substrate-binding protein